MFLYNLQQGMDARTCFYCLFNGLIDFWRVEPGANHEVLGCEWSSEFLIKIKNNEFLNFRQNHLHGNCAASHLSVLQGWELRASSVSFPQTPFSPQMKLIKF